MIKSIENKEDLNKLKHISKTIIFLDIDEVLCGLFSAFTNNSKIPNFWQEDLSKEHFNLESLRLIKKLKELANADIVLSSTWRLDLKTPEDKQRLENILGFGILDVTGYDSTGFRGHEIQKYVLDNNIENYVIIDDSSDFHDFQLERLVHVKMWKGFDMDNFLDACNILNIENKIVHALQVQRAYYIENLKSKYKEKLKVKNDCIQ